MRAVAVASADRPVDVCTSDARRRELVEGGHWDQTTLAQRLAEHSVSRADAIAVVDNKGERVRTFTELNADVSRVANYLIECGVGAGDVVSVQLPNWYETVVVDLGALRVGAIINPMLPLYRERELEHMLTVSRSKVLFTPQSYREHDFVAMVRGLRSRVPTPVEHVAVPSSEEDVPVRDWLADTRDHIDVPFANAADVSELIFTSGTEAEPKAVMHTEQTTNFAVRTMWSTLGLTSSDVVWMPSPIGHSTGLNYGVRAAVYHGLPLVLQDRWSGGDALDLVEQFDCSYTLAATTFLKDLVEEAQARGRVESSLRLFGCGGAPVPPMLVEAANRAGIQALRLYGSTEVLVATWNRPSSPSIKKAQTDGLPVNGVEIDVRRADGISVRGEPGELMVRSPSSCVGFFADPDRTSATFEPDGWIHSGDLGVLDEDGYVSVVGRKKEIIIRGGINIAPRELEDMITTLPQVASVAVIGLPHTRLGEVTCACVVVQDDHHLELPELVEALKAKGIATYKLPQALVLIDALPMTPTGKIKKGVLIERIQAGSFERTTTFDVSI